MKGNAVGGSSSTLTYTWSHTDYSLTPFERLLFLSHYYNNGNQHDNRNAQGATNIVNLMVFTNLHSSSVNSVY